MALSPSYIAIRVLDEKLKSLLAAETTNLHIFLDLVWNLGCIRALACR